MTCSAVSPLWVIVPPLLWLLWYGPRSDRRYVAALEAFHSSPQWPRYVKALEKIATAPRGTRSSPRSGARQPKGRGR